MNENQEVETRKRRSREEVKRLVMEFEASGIGKGVRSKGPARVDLALIRTTP